MDSGLILGLANIAGILMSWLVYYSRAGLADIKAKEGVHYLHFLLPNLPWFVMTWAKCLVWELVFVAWLVQGMPPSRWKALTTIDGRPAHAIVRVRATKAAVSDV